MCGIAGLFGAQVNLATLDAMIAVQQHRGPDAHGRHLDQGGRAALGHNRLSIIDLSPAGQQPMSNYTKTCWLVFNGEIYNYRELRAELQAYPFRTHTDSEVILAAYERWGERCLEHFIGMFAFLLWDSRQQKLFAARDRFGVKPLYYAERGGTLYLASEIKTLHAAGIPAEADETAWATYLSRGLHEHTSRTFWQHVQALPPGHTLTWQAGRVAVARWYDLAAHAAVEDDTRPLAEVQEEYLALLTESVRLRFRADVPVGINLSGGLDSATLLGLVQAVQGPDSEVQAFTFATGDPQYDELPWVRQMLAQTRHPSVVCLLQPADVPALAASVQHAQDEPFGGLPTLAYARLFEQARARGVIVLLDGQGLDEQWAGYDYYAAALHGQVADVVQGTQEKPVRPACLTPEFRHLAEPFEWPQVSTDALRNLQYRDARLTKLPRALRFNDRVSMRASTELREPFLDHRLFELALRQPAARKIKAGVHKWLPRQIAARLLPAGIVEAPKRPLQTPQREWLRGPLRGWANDLIETALTRVGGTWLEVEAVRREWQSYQRGMGDNSFYLWQWLSLGLGAKAEVAKAGVVG